MTSMCTRLTRVIGTYKDTLFTQYNNNTCNIVWSIKTTTITTILKFNMGLKRKDSLLHSSLFEREMYANKYYLKSLFMKKNCLLGNSVKKGGRTWLWSKAKYEALFKTLLRFDKAEEKDLSMDCQNLYITKPRAFCKSVRLQKKLHTLTNFFLTN